MKPSERVLRIRDVFYGFSGGDQGHQGEFLAKSVSGTGFALADMAN